MLIDAAAQRGNGGGRGFVRVVVGVVALVALVGVPVVAASADTADGFWYFDTFHVQAAHDAGFTGEGVTIAMLDTQINLDVPTLKGADIEVQPSQCWDAAGVKVPPMSKTLGAWHGTNVASLIVGSGAGYAGQAGVKGVAPKAKLLYYMALPEDASLKASNCWGKGGKGNLDTSAADYVNSAVAKGAQIISVSLTMDAPSELVAAVANAEHHGVVVVAGLSNGLLGTDGKTPATWPASANGVVAVQRIGADGKVPLDTAHGQTDADSRAVVAGPGDGILTQGSAQTGSWQTQVPRDGTSNATPIVASFLALVKQKYPKATGNQLIQTLIHNTGVDDHPLARGESGATGYGVAVLTHMLRVDHTQYPNVNPLVRTVSNVYPTAAMIANPPAVKAPTSSASPSATAPGKAAAAMPWLLPVIIGGGVLVLLVIGLIVLLVVLASRKAQRPPGSGQLG
ncbi:MAG: S8/S53 family peptidase [Lacisediminihabitans sp.]